MVAKSGTRLISNNAINILKEKLIKKSMLVTPNIPEAEVLTNIKIKNVNDMIEAWKYFTKTWCKKCSFKRWS